MARVRHRAPTSGTATIGIGAVGATVTSIVDAAPGDGDIAISALDATVATSDNVVAQAQEATIGIIAGDVEPVGQANVNAEAATIAVTTHSPDKHAMAGETSISMEAHNPQVAIDAGTIVTAEVASFSVSALNATVTISGENISAEAAIASIGIAAFDATVVTVEPPAATYSFFPPAILENMVSNHPFIQRLQRQQGVSVVKREGEFVTARYVVPETLDGRVEGRDYFVGGHHYDGIPEDVALELIASGFEPELENA